MANNDNPSSADLVTVDPNFSLPPGVAGMEYVDPDAKGDTDVERDIYTGMVVAEEYGAEDWSVPVQETNSLGLAPDYINVVQQIMRITTDGRYVVDLIIDVEDLPGVTGYEVGMTKQ